MLRRLILTIAVSGSLHACAHAPRRAHQVELSDDAPPIGCDAVGRVRGRAATGPLSFEDARGRAEDELRAEAARRGATFVQVTGRDEPGATTVVVSGVAYRCRAR